MIVIDLLVKRFKLSNKKEIERQRLKVLGAESLPRSCALASLCALAMLRPHTQLVVRAQAG